MNSTGFTRRLLTGVRHTSWLHASLAITVASFAACTTPPAQDSKAHDLKAHDLKAHDLKAHDLKAKDSKAQDSKAQDSKALAVDCCTYFEPFMTVSVKDCESDRCEVHWCEGAETVKFSCAGSPGRALGVRASESGTGWPVARVSWGERDAREVRIEFRYMQLQGEVPDPDLANSRLEIQWSESNTFDPDRCPTSGFKKILCLNRTSDLNLTCFPASIAVPVPEGAKAVYIRFAKSKSTPHTPLLNIDDLRITVVEDT